MGKRGCDQDGSVRAVGRVSLTWGGWGERIAGADTVGSGAAPVAGAVDGVGHVGAVVCTGPWAVAAGPDHAGRSVTAGLGRLTLPKTNGRIAPTTSPSPTPKTSLIDSDWLMMRPLGFSTTFGVDFESRSGI